jgi:hypothetical protein
MLRQLHIPTGGHGQGQPLEEPHAGSYIDRDWPTPGQPSLYGLWMDPEYVTQIALRGSEDVHGLSEQFGRDMIRHCHNLEQSAPGYKP